MPRPIENLREDPDNRNRCPVSLLLALAIEDGTLDGITRAADIGRMRFPPGHAAVRLTARTLEQA